MAFTTGTAANHTDLYNKLIAFLTTNADLVADDAAWTKAWTHPDGEAAGIVVRGPGLASAESIPVGLSLFIDPILDASWINITGMSGVISSATEMAGHRNVSPTKTRMFLDSAPMTYWFVASGRRFVVVVKISTVFETMYGGLFLPYADPTRYAYPYMIGGSAGKKFSSSTPDSWRSVYTNHAHFPFAYYSTAGDQSTALQILSPAGEWLIGVGALGGGQDGDLVVHPNREVQFLPYLDGVGSSYNNDGFQQNYTHGALTATKDGLLTMTYLHLVRHSVQEEVYGVMDGCFRVVGFANSSENLITLDGVDHLTVQNAYRTTVEDYWALKLE